MRRDDELAIARLAQLQRVLLLQTIEVILGNCVEAFEIHGIDDDRLAF
jgi:hypothetical protein